MIVDRLVLACAAVALPAALFAQAAPAPTAGATADRDALIASCSAHKFEKLVVLDPVLNRTTRVKLCSVPGASDADWVKTLKSAIVQIEQRRMPGEAKAQLIADLEAEIARFDPAAAAAQAAVAAAAAQAAAAPPPAPPAGLAARGPATMPNDRFETSVLPSLERRPVLAPQERFEVATLPPLNPPRAGAAAAAAPARPMAFSVKCLARGERGNGATCDFFEKDTVLALRAVGGLEQGARLRFLRRGDDRGEVQLAAMQPGTITRVALPDSLCRGVKTSKVELALLAPKSSAVSARLGPFGLRC